MVLTVEVCEDGSDVESNILPVFHWPRVVRVHSTFDLVVAVVDVPGDEVRLQVVFPHESCVHPLDGVGKSQLCDWSAVVAELQIEAVV